MICEEPLMINVCQTLCHIKGSYELSPIPIQSICAESILQPKWCVKPTASYKLIDVTHGEVHDIKNDAVVTIGRNGSCTVVLANLSVSRFHACLMHDSLNQTFLVDMGSSHGTFIGNHRLKPYTPTLITKKSLMRFGFHGPQFLLLVIPSNATLIETANRFECDEEREIFINTSLNLINLYPTNIAKPMNDIDIGRMETLNFMKTISHGLSELGVEPQRKHSFRFASPPLEHRELEGCKHLSLHDESSNHSRLIQSSSSSSLPPLPPPPPLPSSSSSSSSSIIKSSGYQLKIATESTIKRCADEAGVHDDEIYEYDNVNRVGLDLADDVNWTEIRDLSTSPRHRRRKLDAMKNSSNDHIEDQEGYSMNSELQSDIIDRIQLQEDRHTWLSTRSMSLCDEYNGNQKKKKCVRFADTLIVHENDENNNNVFLDELSTVETTDGLKNSMI